MMMPKFTIKARERYNHISTYEVETETLENAIELIRDGEIEDYESTELDHYDPDDEFLAILTVHDEAGNQLELPEGCSTEDYEDKDEVEYCDECGAKIPDDAEDVINPYHEKSCSCYPDNGA
jgi:hypothetical protein